MTGQNGLYASAVKDETTKEVILKIVNTGVSSEEVVIDLKGLKTKPKAEIITINGDYEAANSFEQPELISPKSNSIKVENSQLIVVLDGMSFNMIKATIPY